jgi:beta-galactosidase/beta-glucuronidase
MSSGNTIPRPEYPRPQFVRDEWINLNGPWTFTFDFGKSGKDRKLQESKGFDREITVPFCPESDLSGVGHKDFIEMMWYHRPLAIPVEWKGKRIVLHFGAVDWECDLHIDGQYVGAHYGGLLCRGKRMISFSMCEMS